MEERTFKTPKGLVVIYDFITENEEENLLELIDSLEWLDVLKRRVQQYGRSYDYGSKNLGSAPSIPQEIKNIGEKIPLFEREPDQVIVNEYKSGQGISAHTDHYRHFGPVVATLSLGCEVPMIFKREGKEKEVKLPRRSVAILAGESRSSWTHEIPSRKKDDGVTRTTRVSITYRTVISDSGSR